MATKKVEQLHDLFLNRGDMSWDEFLEQVRVVQKGSMGDSMEVMLERG
jgi:hypothetical protein